jgi:hypothetical protein
MTHCASITSHLHVCSGKRGPPGQGPVVEQVVYHGKGALASSLMARRVRIIPPRCCILITNKLDNQQLPQQEFLDSYEGQSRAQRGHHLFKALSF